MDLVEGEHFNINNSKITDASALILAAGHFAEMLEQLAEMYHLDEYIQTKITETIN